MTVLLFGKPRLAVLLEEAELALRATTISYPDWQRRVEAGKYADVTVTKWWQAFDKIRQAREL